MNEDEQTSWFREEHERAKARNAQIPAHARMVITNPAMSAHSRGNSAVGCFDDMPTDD